ncbi:hypothetical protein A3J44_01500 [candidate division WOR-1 bacterium RIFCSPHIGHO2_02_FULL_45_12]|nr:MAG: hypothetical protein A3J44_01500 [candidate division WOR-1 bacterium RIFCSPHIGHO2_02_FULL_45_12]
MAKAKIDQVLEKIGIIGKDVSSLKDGQNSLAQDVVSLKQGQQKNYDLIQKQGIMLEQIASDVKAVAEGHGVLLRVC